MIFKKSLVVYPGNYRYIFISVILISATIGLLFSKEKPPFSIDVLFEGLILVSLFFFVTKFHLKIFHLFIITVIYISVSYYFAVVISGNNLKDFLLIYKAYIYLLVLTFCVGKNVFDKNDVKFLFYFLLGVFFLKYSYSKGLGITDRPIVLRENNYELMFLSLVYYLKYISYKKSTLMEQALLLYVYALSGSRSAVVILLILLLVVWSDRLTIKKIILGSLVISLVSVIIIYVFQERMAGREIESIDRYKFFIMFLHDVSDWSWVDFLFGSSRITPMSDYVCSTLAYWETLFSFSGDGSCYSVILHSFVLRVVFDHGLIGFFFIIYFLKKAFSLSNYRNKDFLAVFLVLFLNAISVSSFNSVYYMLAMVMYLALDRRNEEYQWNSSSKHK